MKFLLIVILCLCINNLNAQEIPVKEYAATGNKPLVIYISGDGGYNDFTKTLCKNINAKGYPVAAVNARSYFWKKKTPQQAAKDFGSYLGKKFSANANQQFILVGFSFGADVLPFIANRLPEKIKARVVSNVMIAPSKFTDFEVHLSEMLGVASTSGMDVVAEVNKMSAMKVTVLQSKDSKNFPSENISVRNFKQFLLSGSHHFDNDIPGMANLLMSRF